MTNRIILSPWDYRYQSTYQIRILDKESYASLKDEINKIFSDIHKKYPDLTPRIKFFDHAKSIYIGHSYHDFYFLIPENLQRFFPPPKDLNFTSNEKISRLVGESRDLKVFAFDTGHTLKYNQKVIVAPFALNKDVLTSHPGQFSPLLPKCTTKDNLIPSLLEQKNQPLRLVVGEQHSNTTGRDMLIAAMPLLKNKGITLAVEGLYFESHQAVLDHWHVSKQSSLPSELRQAAARTGLRPLLEAAKKNKVRILAIDTESLTGTPDLIRASSMNDNAQKIIDHNVGQGGFIAFVGAGHAADYTLHTVSGDVTVRGLGSRLENSISALILNSPDLQGTATHKAVTIYDSNGFHAGILKAHIVLPADHKKQITPSQHVYKIEEIPSPNIKIESHDLTEKIDSKSHENSGGQQTSNFNTENKKGQTSSSLSTHKEPNYWNGKFKTTYRIQIDENMAHVITQGVNGKSVIKTYKDLKDQLHEACKLLHKTDPTFTPLIRFNDPEKIVEIGNTYFAFSRYVSKASQILKDNLPNVGNLIFSDPNHSLGSKHAIKILLPTSDHLLQSSNGKSFGFSPTHEAFKEEVEISRKIAPQSYLAELPPGTQRHNLIETLVKQAKDKGKSFRLIIGEHHDYITARNMIFDALINNKLPENTTLALEGICYKSEQHLLNTWMKADNKAPFPDELNIPERKDLIDLCMVAKTKGVKILGIDSELLLFGLDRDRIPYMNYFAKQVIDREVGGGHFIALVGAAHAADEVDISSNSKTVFPGLRSLLKDTLSAIVLPYKDEGKVYTPATKKTTIVKQGNNGLILESDIIIPNPVRQGESYKWCETQDRVHRRSSIFDLNQQGIHEDQTPQLDVDDTTKQDTSTESDKKSSNSVSSNISGSEKISQSKVLHFSPKSGLDKGMSLLGFAGGVNELYRGRIINGTIEISESITDVAEIAARAADRSRALAQMVNNGVKTAAHITKIAQKFGKVIPWVGGAFSVYSMGQDGYALGQALKKKDGLGIIKEGGNLLLDAGLLVCNFIPGPGTVVAIGLVGTRMFFSAIFDQVADPEAYKKTWAILKNDDATTFEKVIAAPTGAIQFSWSYTPLGLYIAKIENLYLKSDMGKLDKLKGADAGSFVNFIESKTQDAYVVDFKNGEFSNHAGFLNVVIKEKEIHFDLERVKGKKISHTLKLNAEAKKTPITIKMGQGVTYDYTIKTEVLSYIPVKHISQRVTKVTVPPESLHSFYDATATESSVIFVAPSEDPTQLTDTVTGYALSKGHNSFHYTISGGKGESTYILGEQNATVICGSSKNTLILSFQGTHSRTIALKNFRDDGSCTIELKNMHSSSDLFQKAKIRRMDDGLNLHIGETTLKFDKNTNLKKLLIQTKDTSFAFDLSLVSADTHEHSLKDTINATYMGHENLWKKDPIKYLDTLKDTQSISSFLADLMENTNAYTGIKQPDFYKELGKLADYIELEKKEILEKKDKLRGPPGTLSPCDKKYHDDYMRYMEFYTEEPVYDCITSADYEILKDNSLRSIKNKAIDFLRKNMKNSYYGTIGSDIFIINQKESGRTEITNFDNEKDQIKIIDLKTYEDVLNLIDKANPNGDDVFIEFDQYNSITLKNMQVSALTADDFYLGNIF